MLQTEADKSENIEGPKWFPPNPRANRDRGTIGQAACIEICNKNKKFEIEI